jgi:hypothetical protein
MNVTELIPQPLHKDLHWLGNAPQTWFSALPGKRPEGDDRPRTEIHVRAWELRKHKGSEQHTHIINTIEQTSMTRNHTTLVYLESASRALADGPKLFRPTEEQWESMEQVEMHLPMKDFRTPYPVMFVSIPSECRRRLMQKFKVDPNRMPQMVMIRFRQEPGENSVVFLMSKFGRNELFHVIQDQEGNENIEDALKRKVDEAGPNNPDFNRRDRENEFPCSQILGRVVMNLCIMLTHYGYELSGPVSPHDYNRHRSKKHLQHFKYGDFLSVNMKQNIVLRARPEPTLNAPGLGMGIEVAPHWRRGSWCAYPGQAAKRAAGEKVPLYFRRPCLVRSDRIKGDIAESEVTYTS